MSSFISHRTGQRMRAGCARLALALLGALLTIGTVHAERVEDLATVAGVRSNQLVGYGLVVGLDGTGDQTSQTPFTIQSIENMLAKFGVTVPSNTNPMLKNVAAVTVHATLPPFSKPGQTIDITVSSIGNATSLRGGSLVMTPLSGADGQVYAMAQGSVLVSGFGVEGKDGSSITVNIPSSGRIPNGATVERSVPTNFDSTPFVTLNLNTPDFTTASRLTSAINKLLGPDTAEALDAVSVRVRAPIEPSQRIAYVSTLERLDIDPAAPPARVIINSRTGTVVISSEVHVLAAAVASGSLTVTITERSDVSQPNAFSNGATTVTPRSTLDVKQDKAHMFKFPAGVNLNEIVAAVNSVGAAPGDLVAILEALKEAGALRAQLIVI
ncbi:MAG TPA: flagellar basal body P-ring protein FlgI [Steroidobacteraceae bacterium]|nr:flagellar basal body P-ring protein FlgI [Steroidobacteraceae bacterium]